MNVALLFCFLLSFSYAAVIENADMEAEYRYIMDRVNDGQRFSAVERGKLLFKAKEYRNKSFLDLVITEVFKDSSDFRHLTEEDLSRTYASLKNDPTIVAEVSLRFNPEGPDALDSYMINLFRQEGHRIHVTLQGHKYIDFNCYVNLLNDLIDTNRLDLNTEMLASAKAKRFDLVYYFVSRGADINYHEDGDSVLFYALTDLKRGKFEFFKNLIDNGLHFNINTGLPHKNLTGLAFFMGKYDVISYAIKEKVPIYDLWRHILHSHQYHLFDEALANSYRPTDEELLNLINTLISWGEVALAEKFFDLGPSRGREESFLRSVFAHIGKFPPEFMFDPVARAEYTAFIQKVQMMQASLIQ